MARTTASNVGTHGTSFPARPRETEYAASQSARECGCGCPAAAARRSRDTAAADRRKRRGMDRTPGEALTIAPRARRLAAAAVKTAVTSGELKLLQGL
jgi:hypothetical protein